jgi:ParB family transcriptional regulator, chromosome partitioning protein
VGQLSVGDLGQNYSGANNLDAQADHDGDDPYDPSLSEDQDDEGFRPSLGAEQALRKEYGFSQLLIDDLKAHRLQITRAHLAAEFTVAFDLALYGVLVICAQKVTLSK